MANSLIPSTISLPFYFRRLFTQLVEYDSAGFSQLSKVVGSRGFSACSGA